MPVLCDFTVIQDGTIRIGDGGVAKFSKNFNTGGRHNTQAMLMLNVKGLTDSFAAVRINNTFVKAIQPNANADSGHWFSQHMVIQSSLLSASSSSTANKIEIFAVDEDDNVAGDFDDFDVRDIVIFFHQAA